jgi:hypothetical protein
LRLIAEPDSLSPAIASPRRPNGEKFSAGFFEILGVNPVLGRTFRKEEDRLGANPTAMISEGL